MLKGMWVGIVELDRGWRKVFFLVLLELGVYCFVRCVL